MVSSTISKLGGYAKKPSREFLGAIWLAVVHDVLFQFLLLVTA